MALKLPPVNAKGSLQSIDRWRTGLWPAREMERKIEEYANGGLPPGLNSDDSTCEQDFVPMGAAKLFMQEETDPLTDPLNIEPGTMSGIWNGDAEDAADRKTLVEAAMNIEINEIVAHELTQEYTYAAGRVSLTGRAALYRSSPNAWKWKNGWIIHPLDYGMDTLDDSFREWAFQGKLTLKEIEEGIRTSKDDGKGWSKEGLERLKLWIMASECDKNPKGSWASAWGDFSAETWLAYSLDGSYACTPIDVYWYYRKNGRRTEDDPDFGGHEKVDLYCISRFGNAAKVKTVEKDGTQIKFLEIDIKSSGDEDVFRKKVDAWRRSGNDVKVAELEDNERLLYFFEDRFKSVDETLNIPIDDVRIAGEQKMAEVRGVGRAAMPLLAVKEGLLSALYEGLTFVATPLWSVENTLAEADKRQLERRGISSYMTFPQGIKALEKQNAMSNMGQVMEGIQMASADIAATSRTAALPNGGGSDSPRFAAEASARLDKKQQTASRRLAKWVKSLSKMNRLSARVLLRPEKEIQKSWPCYWDAKRLRDTLSKKYKIKASEIKWEDWTFSARSLSGAMQRQQAVAVGGNMIQLLGPIFPSIVPQIGREICRAVYGDILTSQWLGPSDKQIKDQAGRAFNNVGITFVTGIPQEVDPMDDPSTNIGVVLKFASDRLQLYQQAGFQLPSDKKGMSAVLIYGANFIKKLPEQIQEQFKQQFVALAQAGEKIPVTRPPQENEPTPLEIEELKLKQSNQESLNKSREAAQNHKDISTLLSMRAQGTQENNLELQKQNSAVKRAKDIAGIAKDLKDTEKPKIP